MNCESIMEDATHHGRFSDLNDAAVDDGTLRIFKSCFIGSISGRNAQIARIVYILSRMISF